MAEVTDKDIEDTLRAAGVSGKVPEHLGVEPDHADTLREAGVDISAAHQPVLKNPRFEEPAEPGLRAEEREYVEKGKKQLAGTVVGAMAPIVEGVPFAGPATRAATAMISGAVPGMGFPGDTYNDRVGRNKRVLDTMVGEHIASMPPGYVIPAELAGGAMTVGPLAATRLGSLALGMRGSSLGSRTYWGGAGGASISALDAIARGENPVLPAAIGMGAGVAAPWVGEGGRKLGGMISEHVWPRPGPLKDVSPVNINRLTGALEAETPASIDIARKRMGPTGFMSDLNPEMSDIALGLHSGTGRPKAVIQQKYELRHAQQAGEMKTVLDKTVAPLMDDVHWQQFTTDTHKAQYTPLYQAWEKARVQPTQKLKDLIPRLEKAGAFAKAEEISGISGEPINTTFFTTGNTKSFPTAKSWQYVKQGLNSRIDAAYSAGEKDVARALVKLKGELTNELYATPQGKLLQQADKSFSDMNNILEQHAAGRDTFVGGREGTTKWELREELKHLTPVEQMARIQGLRSVADEAMGATIKGDTTLRNKILAPNNQEKIKMILGQKDGKELIERMEQLKYIGDKKNAIIGGSQTTPRASARDALRPPQSEPWGLNLTQPGTYFPPSVRENVRPSSVMDAWRKQRYGDADNQLAGMLTLPQSDPRFDLIMRALRSEAQRRQTGSAVVDRAGNALTGMIALPAPTTARRQILP